MQNINLIEIILCDVYYDEKITNKCSLSDERFHRILELLKELRDYIK